MATMKVLLLGILLVGGSTGRLLPQALEDVHKYVQRQLLHRSHGEQRKLAMDGPPPPARIAIQTSEPYMGTPVILQSEVRLDGNGGIAMPGPMPGFPIAVDPNTAGSQLVSQVVVAPPPPAPLPTGLMPPVPLQLNQGDLQVQASTNLQSGVIPANLVGPSTFVSEVPRNNQGPPSPPPPPPPPQQQQYQQPSQPQQQYQQPPQQQYQQQQPLRQQYQQQSQQQYQQPLSPQNNNGDKKGMDGWLPLDNEGSRFAKGVGIKLQTDDDLRRPAVQPATQPERQPDYRDTGYSIQKAESDKVSDGRQHENELELIHTSSVKLGATPDEDIVINTQRKEQKKQFPIYPGRASPKVVIHAQNVIIRSGPDGTIEQIDANNDTLVPVENPAVKQFPAYQGVPQLNNYLREQLRFAAMNQLLQSAMEQHPLSDKPFPRPLSLREIAAAVRNGEFPQPTRDQLALVDPMTTQPSMMNPTHLQLNIPHVVKMNPDVAPLDALTLPSIQNQGKVVLPGGLGNLYKNILQQETGVFDPTDPVEYSLLAALSGQRTKAHLRTPKPPSTLDYGDSVKYSAAAAGEHGKVKQHPKQLIQILETEPSLGSVKPQAVLANTGNLRDVSDQVLKQLLLQELREVEDEPQILLPAGLGPQAPAIHRPFRTLKPAYGTNAHPFAFLGEEEVGGADIHAPANYEETIEYTLPPGVSLDDYLHDDGRVHVHTSKRPSSHHHGYEGLEDGDTEAMPLNKDTLVKLGKSALSTALEFSRHHNPLTFFSRIRSLPPVKVDLYRVPLGIPESIVSKLPKEGGPPPSHYAKRGRRKHLSRKNNKH